MKISFEKQDSDMFLDKKGMKFFDDRRGNWCAVTGNVYTIRSDFESKPKDVSNNQPQAVLELLLEKFEKFGSVEKAIFEAGRFIDGEFSCVAGIEGTIGVFSDFIGSRPIWYIENEVGTPRKVFEDQRSSVLCHGQSLVHSLGENSFHKAFDVLDLKKDKKELFHPTPIELKELFEDAVQKRLKGVKKAAVLFSGGVDSSTVAKCVSNYCDVSLFVAGIPGAKDILEAKIAANAMDLPLTVVEVNLDEVEDALCKALPLIGTTHPMHAAIAVTEYVVGMEIKQCGLEVVLSGQGSDELFCTVDNQVLTLKSGENKTLTINVLTPDKIFDFGTPYPIDVYVHSIGNNTNKLIGSYTLITKGIYFNPLFSLILFAIFIVSIISFLIYIVIKRKRCKKF